MQISFLSQNRSPNFLFAMFALQNYDKKKYFGIKSQLFIILKIRFVSFCYRTQSKRLQIVSKRRALAYNLKLKHN